MRAEEPLMAPQDPCVRTVLYHWLDAASMYLSTLSLERAATVRVIGFSKPKPVLENLFVTRMDIPFQG